jgi:hypothetical protein
MSPLKMLFRRWIHSLSRLNIPWGGFFISIGNLQLRKNLAVVKETMVVMP